MRLISFSAAVLLSFVLPVPATALGNADATLVLHIVPEVYPSCDRPDPCTTGGPMIEATASGDIQAVFIVLRNLNDARGVLFALDWDPGWTYLPGGWGTCTGNCENPPSGPGPIDGLAGCIFPSCITTPESVIVARAHFIVSSGCIEVIEADSGAAVRDCAFADVPVAPLNFGRICVGAGGRDTCEPAPTVVEAATWSAIKGQYSTAKERR